MSEAYTKARHEIDKVVSDLVMKNEELKRLILETYDPAVEYFRWKEMTKDLDYLDKKVVDLLGYRAPITAHIRTACDEYGLESLK